VKAKDSFHPTCSKPALSHYMSVKEYLFHSNALTYKFTNIRFNVRGSTKSLKRRSDFNLLPLVLECQVSAVTQNCVFTHMKALYNISFYIPYL
jgi:hypothetical protein